MIEKKAPLNWSMEQFWDQQLIVLDGKALPPPPPRGCGQPWAKDPGLCEKEDKQASWTEQASKQCFSMSSASGSASRFRP
jgi:hypothetical protein